MTDQNTPEAVEDDDDQMPPVHFALRNVNGDADEIVLEQHLLGHGMYVLMRPGEDGLNVSGSHVDLDNLGFVLAWSLAAILQADRLTDDGRAAIAELLEIPKEEA